MWTFFLILTIFGVLALMFYILLELNELEKRITTIVKDLKKHYENEINI